MTENEKKVVEEQREEFKRLTLSIEEAFTDLEKAKITYSKNKGLYYQAKLDRSNYLEEQKIEVTYTFEIIKGIE
tara:strand:- start:233 stop:454 length:222 start_codon:yes stop_codon:yes gene_type:complete